MKKQGENREEGILANGDISWLSQKKEWPGLKNIILSHNTITGSEGEVRTEERYFISNLPLGIEEIARALDGGKLSLASGYDLS